MEVLNRVRTFRVVPPRPYSLALTASRFSRFPEVVDRFDGERYERLVYPGGRPLLVRITQRGAPSQAVLSVELQGPNSRAAASRDAAEVILRRSLGARSDVGPFARAFRNDPILRGPLRAFRGLRVAGWPDAWEALVTTVLSQQVNLAFAYDIRRELALALGRRSRWEGKTYVAFPPAAAFARLDVPALRRFRLSRAKAETILLLARAFSRGDLSHRSLASLDDGAVVERLTSLKGIGRWTAETVLLRGLGRLDAFPAGDLGVVKYLALGLLERNEVARESDMRRYAERWRPYRGLALVYAYAELARRERI